MEDDTVGHIIENTIAILVQIHFEADRYDRIKIWKYISALELLQKAAFSERL